MGLYGKRLGYVVCITSLGMILSAGTGGCAKSTVTKPGSSKPVAGSVRFTVAAPGAKQVFLVGSFNGWVKDATPMNVISGTDRWSIDVPLTAGEHTFMYLIDGIRWMTPPSADDFITDEFGHTNGVVIAR